MSLTQNQVDDSFQQQLGRPATPYEYSQYSGADLQKIANIGNEYKSLNTDQSIVDYLKFSGQDSSLASRQKLGAQYGITNIGSAEGNEALMKALKGGAPNTTKTAPVSGTVTGATNSTPAPAPNTSGTVDGSVSGASGGNVGSGDPVTDALNQYKTAQSAVADIDNTLAGLLQAKKDEVAKSGGVVDEAQLKSIVYSEQQPLLNQRKQLVSEQTQANNNYKDALAQQKLTDSEQKQADSQWKTVNMPVYDQYGNVVAHKLVDVNAAQGITRSYNSSGSTSSGSGSSGGSSGATGTVINGSKGPGISSTDPAAGSSPSISTPKSAPLNTNSSIDLSTPGYTTANVIYQGKDTQTTQSFIDLQAINAIMGGKTTVASGGRSTKSPAFYATEAINARIGQLDPGGNLALNKAEAAAWGKTLSTQIAYAANLTRSLNSADQDFQQILQKYDSMGINDHNVPIANLLSNAAKYNLGNGDVSAFKASLSELGNLYQQVFSRGGQVTDTVRNQANDIINGNLSLANLQKVADQLQSLGKIDVDQANKAVQDAENQFKGISPGSDTSGGGTGSESGFNARGSTDAKTFVENTFESLYPGKSENDIVKQYSGSLQKGETLAFDNNTGAIVAASKDDINSGNYTPI